VITLSWSGAELGWFLESSAGAAGAAWKPVPEQPVLIDGKWTVTLQEQSGPWYYRLSKS
jgi:hypothetical protein